MAARPQVEASSLSAINDLAANPPQYPYHPELRESLTLYISRVPGTQDVILSTFRPLKKNVTVDDVANSLYYVHLDSPEDELLAARERQERAVSPRSSGESGRSTIPRKPVPTASAVAKPHDMSATNTGATHQPPVTAAPSNAFRSANAEHLAPPPRFEARGRGETVEGYRHNPVFQKRQSGGPSDAQGLSHHQPAPAAARIPRRTVHATPPGASSAGLDVPSYSSDARAHGRPVTPTGAGAQSALAAPISSPISPGRVGGRPSSVSFSLTLIRRDPTSGSQSNIGKVISFQTNVPTPDAADPSLDPDNMGALIAHTQNINIRLETSGYAKYRDLPSRAEVDAYRPASAHSFAQQMMRGGAAGLGSEKTPAHRPGWRSIEEGFSRQVAMSYGASWKSNIKKAFQRKERPGDPVHAGGMTPEDPSAPTRHHARHGSASTTGSVDSADDRHSPTIITRPGPGLKPKGYVFLSPWNGRCEFRTSVDGRSIKCRHILDPASAKLDPREVAQSIRDAQAVGRSRGDQLSSALVGAKPVSELRFNLPQGGHRQTPSQEEASKGGRWSSNRISGSFGKLLQHRAQSSEDDWDDDEHDDYDGSTPQDALSLGKEHAGGGTRGTRAKLGKLIIHDEGLKMLDLVVAANIGVWWTTWGRTL